ncbi:phosphate ABC transporter substrate-binding protein [Coraliomargarita sp. SDUM461004]|uniref:Phosphate ABC transporter substrate-binding protein n=1 Tax=Thalassobacterium sedimentorum TaxID=3041258 RepID=A0ABU1AHU1_9BACT|nr:phosphate ABC transporter substrate-binding protein [Coraliomargarita sp. SDUM461004]MDQ8194341.1 phosphate ABC transporter substrate-binding protein [Coraliomargarita sp. SDUM461004]
MKHTYTSLGSAFLLAIALLSGCQEGNRKQAATPLGQSATSRQSVAVTASPAVMTPQPVPAIHAVSAPYPAYSVQVPLQGYLRSIGSDTMDELLAEWEAELGRFQTGLRFRHEGKGSSTAIPALLEQRSDIGPMSRVMKGDESARFEQAFGYKATQLAVAVDTLAVYVHPDNPILQTGLSLEQIAAIFSESDSPLQRWGQLGLTGPWSNAPIRLHGRNPASGTHAFFKSHALDGRTFRESLTEHAGSAEVVRHVGMDPYSIGYSGIAYKTADVATLPLQAADGNFVNANKRNAARGIYPLTRSLYVILNINPEQGPTDLQKEFLRFVYSREGQQIVEQVGYFPIDPAIAQQVLQQY